MATMNPKTVKGLRLVSTDSGMTFRMGALTIDSTPQDVPLSEISAEHRKWLGEQPRIEAVEVDMPAKDAEPNA